MTSTILKHLKRWAEALKRDVLALYLAGRDPRVPWYAKVVALAVAAYALSPIDLIPDFIPVLGYVDDLIIVPVGIWCAGRLVPPAVMASLRLQAERQLVETRPRTWLAVLVIMLIWLATAAWIGWILLR